jgi:hypothetical protein
MPHYICSYVVDEEADSPADAASAAGGTIEEQMQHAGHPNFTQLIWVEDEDGAKHQYELDEVLGATLVHTIPPPANARLLAAAPDLLEALRPLATWAEHERRKHRAAGEENEAEYMGALADAARQAIGRATGK